MNALALWIAQGFGSGRIPVAPGTFGSVVGLGWFAVLLLTHNLWLFLLGTILGLYLSVWLCGLGEKILGQTDPGSIVLDEITAIPLCFVGWVTAEVGRTGAFPGVEHFFAGRGLLATVGVFAAFRLFDVWKPWPVRQAQDLPGGWGVTIDDALAAVYVNVVVLAVAVGKKLAA
ncbi:MAG: phosphatidylglycerophosphatase A [Verrucomicrobiota bacterium]